MNDTPATVLLIEDDEQIRRFLQISLQANNYRVLEARSGEDGLACAAEQQLELVVLDLGLPGIDGLKVISRLREWSEVPVLILSVRDDEQEKVRALDAGANDFVTKPVRINEFMARVRVLLRTKAANDSEGAIFQRNGLRIDLVRREVQLDGSNISLTRKEYQVLRLLVRNAGRVVTHQQMLREVWGPASVTDTHYLRVVISSIRQKLGDESANPRYIVTEQGVGYRLLD
jgi:two-component system KDP operon response regulator KdpE